MASAPASSLANFEGLARQTFFGTLSAGQRKAVQLVVFAAKNDYATMTSVCHYAQDAGIISEPSCRRLIQRLRSLKLIDCGSSESKGRILTLTPLGESILCFEE
jgi:hypothetical protein